MMECLDGQEEKDNGIISCSHCDTSFLRHELLERHMASNHCEHSEQNTTGLVSNDAEDDNTEVEDDSMFHPELKTGVDSESEGEQEMTPHLNIKEEVEDILDFQDQRVLPPSLDIETASVYRLQAAVAQYKTVAALSRKRRCISLEMKAALIEEVDRKTKSKAQICKEYEIPSGTLYTILKEKDNIMKALQSGEFQQDRKKCRRPDFRSIDHALYAWFKQARSQNIPISGPILKRKGKELANKLGFANFKMSSGWLDRFKMRHNISLKTLVGEAVSASAQTVNEWQRNELKTILQEYQPHNIFIADEIGLCFNCLSNRSPARKGKTFGGSTKSQDRFTLMMAVNMDGSEKLPLLAIGKYAKPRCFRNVTTLPTDYESNRQAWMTPAIFEEWVKKLDRKFLIERRSVAVIVDTCIAHPYISDLDAIRLVFLPPNTKRVLHPFEQGITTTFKALFRKRILKKLIAKIETKGNADGCMNMTILNAMNVASAAWDEVKENTIIRCFHLAGFSTATSNEDAEIECSYVDRREIVKLYDRLKTLTAVHLSVDEYVGIDDFLITTREIPIEEIASVSNEDDEDADKSESITQGVSAVSTETAIQSVETLRQFFLQQPASLTALQQLNGLEGIVLDVALKLKKTDSG